MVFAYDGARIISIGYMSQWIASASSKHLSNVESVSSPPQSSFPCQNAHIPQRSHTYHGASLRPRLQLNSPLTSAHSTTEKHSQYQSDSPSSSPLPAAAHPYQRFSRPQYPNSQPSSPPRFCFYRRRRTDYPSHYQSLLQRQETR